MHNNNSNNHDGDNTDNNNFIGRISVRTIDL